MAASGTCISVDTAGWYQKPTRTSGKQNGRVMLKETTAILDAYEKQVGKCSHSGNVRLVSQRN